MPIDVRARTLRSLTRLWPCRCRPCCRRRRCRVLAVILYSREQIRKESAAMGRDDDGETAPWGIISLKAQSVDYVLTLPYPTLAYLSLLVPYYPTLPYLTLP